MARLAGSPVPVPTTFSSTSRSRSLKPGPRSVLWTSTTLTSAPMATLSRVAAEAGTARTRSEASRRMSIVSPPSGVRVDAQRVVGHGEGDAAGRARLGAVDHDQGVPDAHVVAIVGAEKQALLQLTGERG